MSFALGCVLAALLTALPCFHCADVQCDVAIAGGSLASLISALTAADAAPELKICLLEITDWPGGQLTSSAVSALDFGTVNRDTKYMPRTLREFVASVKEKPGQCWVSFWCFDPAWAVHSFVLPAIAKRPNLHVFLRTVVTATEIDALTGALTSLTVVTRTPVSIEHEWDVLLSADISDWYNPRDSARFRKQVSTVMAHVFIEATELGDVLATAGVKTRLGVEVPTEGSGTTDNACTQGTTFTFFTSLTQASGSRVPTGSDLGSPFNLGKFSWSKVWTYRRSAGSGAVAMGDTTQQN